VDMPPNQLIEWSLTKNWAFMGCSVGFKYSKTALVAGAPPRTPLGELMTLPQTSGVQKGGG